MCENNVEVIQNLYGNINKFENKNKDMYNTIEKNNIKMCNKIKKVISDTNHRITSMDTYNIWKTLIT